MNFVALTESNKTYDYKETIKEHGGKWDKEARLWMVPEQAKPGLLELMGVQQTKYFILGRDGREIDGASVSEPIACIMNIFGKAIINREWEIARGAERPADRESGFAPLLFAQNFRPHKFRADSIDLSFWYSRKSKCFKISYDDEASERALILGECSTRAHPDIETAVKILSDLCKNELAARKQEREREQNLQNEGENDDAKI